jgi:hypothetical protein
MSESDWVVLRMVKVGALVAGKTTLPSKQFSEMHRAVDYLLKKYGKKTLDVCIDQLNEEYAK